MAVQRVDKSNCTWGVKPGLPVYLLSGCRVFEVITEELLEICCGECLELEVLQVGFQEGLKGLGSSHKSLGTQASALVMAQCG